MVSRSSLIGDRDSNFELGVEGIPREIGAEVDKQSDGIFQDN